MSSLAILESESTKARNLVCKGVRLIDRAGSRHNRKEQARLRAIVEPIRARHTAIGEAICAATWSHKDERGVWQPRAEQECERVAAEKIAELRAAGVLK